MPVTSAYKLNMRFYSMRGL